VILQRFPLADDEVPSDDSDAAGSCSEVDEFHELDGDAGARSEGGSSSAGEAGRDRMQTLSSLLEGEGIVMKSTEIATTFSQSRRCFAERCEIWRVFRT